MLKWLVAQAEEMLKLEGPMRRGTLPALGWLLPLGMLAAKGIKAVANRNANKKKGEAINDAEQKKVAAAQANRKARLGATQSMLQKMQAGLAKGGYSEASGGGYTGGTAGGAPDYTIDPAALQALQDAPAYVAAPDAKAGQGWGMVGDLAGAAGDALDTYATGQALEGQSNFEELLKRARAKPGTSAMISPGLARNPF